MDCQSGIFYHTNKEIRMSQPATMNRQFRLAARPVGLPKASDWQLTSEPVRAPGEGEVRVRLVYVSRYRVWRRWMNDCKSYI